MKHYEIVIMVHPDQSEQVPSMIERYTTLVTNGKGLVHRAEDSGRRQLAYPIGKVYKAHYAVFNIECDQKVLSELTTIFKFNDAIIRHLILDKKGPATGPSALVKKPETAATTQPTETAPTTTTTE